MQQAETTQIPEEITRMSSDIGLLSKDMTKFIQDFEKSANKGFQEPALGMMKLPTQAEAMDLLVEGFGGASAGALGGYVRGITDKFNPLGMDVDAWAAIVGGWFGMTNTQGKFRMFFRGVLMSGISRAMGDAGFSLGKLTGGFSLGSKAPAATPAVADTAVGNSDYIAMT